MKLQETAPPEEEVQEEGGSSPDLFDHIDGIFQGKDPHPSRPPFFVLHRFLASDRHYAMVAGDLQRRISDEDHLYEIWRAATPEQERSPRLSYPAPGSPDAAGDLVGRLMETMTLSRIEAEEAVQLIEMAGETEAVRAHLGVEE